MRLLVGFRMEEIWDMRFSKFIDDEQWDWLWTRVWGEYYPRGHTLDWGEGLPPDDPDIDQESLRR